MQDHVYWFCKTHLVNDICSSYWRQSYNWIHESHKAKDHHAYTQFRIQHIQIHVYPNSIEIASWTCPQSLAKCSKRCRVFSKEVQPSFEKDVSTMCCMTSSNERYPACKETVFIHVQFPPRNTMVLQESIPYNTPRISLKRNLLPSGIVSR